MKKIAVLFCLMALLVAFTPLGAQPAAADTVTINVYNWGLYIGDGTDGTIDVNAEFTARTGIKVNYNTFETNESLYAKLKTGGAVYDVIIPSDYMVAQLIAEDMLAELNYENIPNFANIDSRFLNPEYDKTQSYSVPYTWGTVGLIYNTKYVTKEVNSWNVLWDEDYKGKILMFDNPRDAFGIGALLLGYGINDTSDEAVTAIGEKLREQKPLVQQYIMDQIYDLMINEEAWVAPYYAGDYLMMREENPNLSFAWPQEGFNVFVDALCIPKNSQNQEAAEAYINFLCDPEISGQNMDAIGYSTPISAAREYLDDELANSNIAYPGEAELVNAQTFEYRSAAEAEKLNKEWLSIKTTSNSLLYVLISVGVLAVLGGMYFWMSRKKKKLR